jgi:hypothetical protein
MIAIIMKYENLLKSLSIMVTTNLTNDNKLAFNITSQMNKNLCIHFYRY